MLAAETTDHRLADPKRGELPTQNERFHTAVWRAVRELGEGGAMFSIDGIRARLPKRVQASAEGYLRLLEDAGFIEASSPSKRNPVSGCYRTRGKLAVLQPVSPPPVPVAFDAALLPLQIPRSHDGIWSLMCWLTRHHRGFTLGDLIEQIAGNIADEDVTAYVRALDRGGFIVPELTTGFDPRYRANLKYIETPRLRADGSLMVGPTRMANLWRTLKMSCFITAEQLSAGASLPELPVSIKQATQYADALVATGYLLARDSRDAPRLYRLKMSTGPRPPVILRARFVWDANDCKIMGQAISIDEVWP